MTHDEIVNRLKDAAQNNIDDLRAHSIYDQEDELHWKEIEDHLRETTTIVYALDQLRSLGWDLPNALGSLIDACGETVSNSGYDVLEPRSWDS